MKRIQSGVAVLFFLVLTACATQAPKDTYYSLVLAAGEPVETSRSGRATKRVVISTVELPQYLDQAGLVMQIGLHEVQVANHHRWAEPLDEAIGKVLVQGLSNRAGDVVVNRGAGRWTAGSDCLLRFEFDRFHATDNSRVVVAGRYWVFENKLNQDMRQEFDITRSLPGDGYATAVRELGAALGALADEVVEQLSANTGCINPTP